MNFKVFLVLLFGLVILKGCFTYKSCQLFPRAFHNVDQAEIELNTAECESLYDSLSLTNTRFLKKAAFYSCDKKFGFLLVTTTEKKILYRNLPLQYWKNMRKAKSFENYFTQNIQYRFPVYLEKKL